MAFSQFKSLAAVAREFQITTRSLEFMGNIADVRPDASLQKRLSVTFAEEFHKASEAARCEFLITPLLYEAWLSYRSVLKLWSHIALEHDAVLAGTPDYLIAKQSELGVAVMGTPILVAVEAKQDDFVLGWGQCAAEMLAVQKINTDEEITVFGIVTNGESWEFGMLEKSVFTRHPYPYTIGDLDKLFGALSYIMAECAKQVTKPHLEVA